MRPHPITPRLVLAALAIGVVGTACGHSPADGEAIDEVCVMSNHRQEVSVSGYLKMIAGDTLCMSDGCPFLLSPSERPGGKDVQKARIYFRRGTGPRQIEIKKMRNPGKDDLLFRDDDGQIFQTGDVIRVTGKVSVVEGSETNSCHFFRPTAIQKL